MADDHPRPVEAADRSKPVKAAGQCEPMEVTDGLEPTAAAGHEPLRVAERPGPVEAADRYCLDPGEAAALLAGHRWRRFAVLGDSVAAGIGDPVDGYASLSWVDRIAAELAEHAPGFAYLNLGEREMLAADVRVRQLEPALAFRPDLTLVAAGGNNALRRSYKPDEVDDELRRIVGDLRAAGADVITIGMFDASHAPAIPDRARPMVSVQLRELSARTAAIAGELGALHTSVTGHPIETDPGMYSADGLHGNLRSHAVCAAEVVRRLGRYLAGGPRGAEPPDPAWPSQP